MLKFCSQYGFAYSISVNKFPVRIWHDVWTTFIQIYIIDQYQVFGFLLSHTLQFN